MKIEGKNAVEELLKSDTEIDKLLIQNGQRDAQSQKIIASARERGVKIQFVDKTALDNESETYKHQGFIAETSDYKYAELDSLLENPKNVDPFIVILDGVEDPHNLGSIIRVCECLGVDGLIISKHRSAVVNETSMRVSEGSANHLKIARVTNINDAIEFLKEKGIWVTAVEIGGENIYGADLTGKVALVIGGENTGVKRLTKDKCDRIVSIPMFGKVNSLNASVACGIAVYEVVRQRIK